MRVRLTRAVAGFAAGTTVVVAAVDAAAVDGADPAATPEPVPDEPEPTATPAPTPSSPARPAKPKVSAAQRLARGRFVFPVYGEPRVADDFGATRQIGAHQGNDVFAAFGSPVLAVADGTLNRVGTLPISGNRLWLKTERGDSFFYAHLSAFAPEAVSGRKVRAGTLLGFVGNTGDAEPTPPHVHFEIHPGDGKAIDPHAVLAAGRPVARCPRAAGSPATAATPRRAPARWSRCATSSRGSENDEGRRRGALRETSPNADGQLVEPAVSLVEGGVGVAAGAVFEVYSNSSSAPNRASSTFLRRSSETASATAPPTTPSSSSLPRPPLRLRFGASRSATDASLNDSAADLRSFCSFLSSKICFVGCLPF